MTSIVFLNYTFFCLLAVAIVLGWTSTYKQQGLYVFSLALVIGLAMGMLTAIGLLTIVVLGIVMYLLERKSLPNYYQWLLQVILFSIFIGFTYHLLPGFHNWKILDKVQLSATATPYTMYLNVEKPVYTFFSVYFGQKIATSSNSWIRILKWSIIGFLIAFSLLMLANSLLKVVAFDPKLPQITFIWILRMLLSVCLAEEAFFRGHLQEKLTLALRKYKQGAWIAWGVVSLLFGLVHWPGGMSMFLMATLAGLTYGFAYLKTGRLEAAVLAHFFVNLVHFLLFSYPMLGESYK